ncbi:MAG: hypothetical protein ACQEXJ_13560 [Myxococcota bacterium]
MRTLLAAVVLAASLAPSPPAAAVEGEACHTGHFVLSTDCDAETRDWVASRLEAFRSALEILVPAATGVALSPEPIRVLLFEAPERYEAWAAEHAPALRHNGGYYDGRTRTVVAYQRSNPLQLQFHEIAHAVMGDVFDDPEYRRYARAGWPVWFDEGFAEYISSWESSGGDFRFGAVHPARLATLADAMRRGRMVPLDRLLDARPGRFFGPDRNLWYASAWGFVDLLLSEPDLRSRVPRWVRRLRAGEHGRRSFLEVFGPDLAALERRLARRVRDLVASFPRSLAPLTEERSLDAWTVHEGGLWEADGEVLEGRGAGDWNYLTRPVPPMDGVVLDVDVQRADGASLGLVLGHHGVGEYPYHTLVELEGGRVAIRHVRDVDRLTRSIGRPATLRAGGWTPVRLTLRRGVVSVWIGGRHVLSARAGGSVMSLLGLWVQGGQGRFRRLALAPAPGYAGGPAAPPPPRPPGSDDDARP